MSSNTPNFCHWFSFRLRTLFIFVTLLGGVGGWIAKERAQSRREMKAVETLKPITAQVELMGRFDDTGDSGGTLTNPVYRNSWWQDALHELLGSRVRSIELAFSADPDLSALQHFALLEKLTLTTNCAQLPNLDALEDLPGLSLFIIPYGLDPESVDFDLTALAKATKLKSLCIFGGRVGDLAPLSCMTSLRKLYVEHVQPVDLAALSELSQLHDLILPQSHPRTLLPLKSLRQVQVLSIGTPDDGDLTPLTELQALTSLELIGDVPHSQVSDLQQALPDCAISVTAETTKHEPD